MFIQFSENLPCLSADYENRRVVFDDSLDREKRLMEFYDYVAYDCYDYFRISPEYARGFY